MIRLFDMQAKEEPSNEIARSPIHWAPLILLLGLAIVAGMPRAAKAAAVIDSVAAIGVAEEHACALTKDGGVRCWGNNTNGELGNGSKVESFLAVRVAGITDATSLAVGAGHACALVTGGAVKCWGANFVGQLGNGVSGAGTSSSTPVAVRGISGATQIAAGAAYTCVVVANGAVKCWGYNEYGQLGNGVFGAGVFSSIPVDVAGLVGVTSLGLGERHSCAVVSSGGVRCWGQNRYGELGYGASGQGVIYAVPGSVWGIVGSTKVAAARDSTCAIVAAGEVKCWGYNAYGQLGNGSEVNSSSPVAVTGLVGATALASGWHHSCAIVAGGAVKCWGWNDKGVLGNGTTVNSSVPVNVLGLTGATYLAAQTRETCAATFGGGAKCWGDNAQGQIGVGIRGSYFASPVSVQRTPGMDVGMAGTGFGSINSNPVGVDCGATCSVDYAIGTRVALTAKTEAGSAFTGWSGDCAGAGICSLSIIDDVLRVTANFSYTGTEWSHDYVQKAYVAYYGRPADPQGQAYWAGQMDLQGGSIAAIINAFGTSDEFTQRYGDLNNTQLVTKIYQQTLGRDPDGAGLAWYVGELNAGRMTLQNITLAVLNGATTAPDSTVVANKLNVAAYFTAKVVSGCRYGTEAGGVSRLAGVGASFLTVTTAKTSIDLACAINLL